MHLKNFSLIETFAGSGSYVLSPAYDLLPVNLLLPEDAEETALTLNGKKANIRRGDFLKLAAACGIPEATASRLITSITSRQNALLSLSEASYLPKDMKSVFSVMIDERCRRLEG